MKNSINRRRFIAGVGTTGLGVLTAGSWSRVLGANDRVVMGILGAGGRGRTVMRTFLKNPGVEFAAVCDVYEHNIGEGMKIAGDRARTTYEYREVLDSKDIQALLIATPDHWHGPMLLAALDAGKDVYLEKPMSHSIEEGAQNGEEDPRDEAESSRSGCSGAVRRQSRPRRSWLTTEPWEM